MKIRVQTNVPNENTEENFGSTSREHQDLQSSQIRWAVLTPPGPTQQFWVRIQVLVGLKHFTDGSLHLLGSQRSLVPLPKTSLYWLVFTHPETAEQKLPFFCQNKTLITVLTQSSDYLLLISANDHCHHWIKINGKFQNPHWFNWFHIPTPVLSTEKSRKGKLRVTVSDRCFDLNLNLQSDLLNLFLFFSFF